MKNFYIFFLLLLWLFISLILVCSLVGLLLFVRTDSDCSHYLGDTGRSSWNQFGHSLLKKLIED